MFIVGVQQVWIFSLEKALLRIIDSILARS